jgi:signal transduction histidine kinase
VDLQFRPDPDLHGVQLDPKAIYRALLNLVTNAVEACAPDGGTVVVETHAVPNEPRFEVVVQDSGCGIPQEDLPKLGSAFFSTKGARGTGLGLSVTYKIVAEHAGQVSVSSQVGQGTTVTMALPIQEGQEETIQSVDLRAEG